MFVLNPQKIKRYIHTLHVYYSRHTHVRYVVLHGVVGRSSALIGRSTRYGVAVRRAKASFRTRLFRQSISPEPPFCLYPVLPAAKPFPIAYTPTLLPHNALPFEQTAVTTYPGHVNKYYRIEYHVCKYLELSLGNCETVSYLGVNFALTDPSKFVVCEIVRLQLETRGQ